jgi:hypothetical protein
MEVVAIDYGRLPRLEFLHELKYIGREGNDDLIA